MAANHEHLLKVNFDGDLTHVFQNLVLFLTLLSLFLVLVLFFCGGEWLSLVYTL